MEFDSHNEDSVMECFDVESLTEEVEAVDDSTHIKPHLWKMMGLIQKQDEELKKLRHGQSYIREQINNNTNVLHKKDERVVELEQYSRKLCLIFSNLNDRGDALTSII